MFDHTNTTKYWKITRYFENMYEERWGWNDLVWRGRVFREVGRYRGFIHLTDDMSDTMTVGFSMRIVDLQYINEVEE